MLLRRLARNDWDSSIIRGTLYPFYVSHGKHGRMHRDKYFSRNEPCPIVVVVGGDPMLFLAGANELSMSEYEWAGGVRGEAFKVIKGKYTGLPIPTRAKIAIEGFCNYGDLMEEGPFGGWTSYYANGSRTLLDGNEIYSHPLQIWGVSSVKTFLASGKNI